MAAPPDAVVVLGGNGGDAAVRSEKPTLLPRGSALASLHARWTLLPAWQRAACGIVGAALVVLAVGGVPESLGGGGGPVVASHLPAFTSPHGPVDGGSRDGFAVGPFSGSHPGITAGRWDLSDVLMDNGLNFAAIGDWGRANTGGQEVTAPVLAAWAEAAGAGFIVSVGDNVYVDGIEPGSTAAQIDTTMKRFFSQPYSAWPYLADKPWYVIAGNHDYRGDVEAQLGWTGDARWHMGLSFTKSWPLPPATGRQAKAKGKGKAAKGEAAAAAAGTGARHCLAAVFTDTTPLIGSYRTPEKMAKHPQLAKNVLAAEAPADTAAWTRAAIDAAAEECTAAVVIGHHPLYSPGEHGNNAELIAEYEAAMEGAGIDAYLAGHDHLLAHSRPGGGRVEHVLTGAGSEVRPQAERRPESVWWANAHGFTLHSVNATHMAHAFVWADTQLAGDTALPDSQGTLPGRIAFAVVRPLRRKAHVQPPSEA